MSVGDLKHLPIYIIDFTKTEGKKKHDDLVALVDKMLGFHEQIAKSNFDSEKVPIERQIKATDQKIDQLVKSFRVDGGRDKGGGGRKEKGLD